MTFKEKVHAAFMESLAGKINAIERGLAELFESGKNETKSTSGDKHETALAMLQIEQENLRRQLTTLLEQKVLLGQLDPSLVSTEIRNGSLIITDRAILYLSTGLGKVIVDSQNIISVSSHSPLGQRLRNLKKGDSAHFNSISYLVTDVQ